ncbi:hypothetical protein ACQ4LE_000346 [Meloidogyne hapla]
MITSYTKRKKSSKYFNFILLILIYVLIICIQQAQCRYRYRTEPMPDTGIVEDSPELLIRARRLATSFLNYLNGN